MSKKQAIKKVSRSKFDFSLGLVLKGVAGLTAIGLGLYAVKKFKNSGFNTKEALAPGKTPNIDTIVVDSTKCTLSNAQVDTIVTNLYNAMSGTGTDENAIHSNLSHVKTQDDMYAIMKKFGVKRYMWWGRTAFIGEDKTLIGWLREELSGSDLEKVNKVFTKFNIPF